jgi:hypothetical protein
MLRQNKTTFKPARMASSISNAICTSLFTNLDLRFKAVLLRVCNMKNAGNPKSSDQFHPLSGRKFQG